MKTPSLLVPILAAAACLLSMPAQAVAVPGLYEARVPVADQSGPERSNALQQAFDAVLVRITGDRAAGGSLAATLGNPNQYIQQYRYEQAPADPANPSAAPGLLLWAKFDAGVVDKGLRAAHARLWGAERPRTLVWLGLPDRILNASDGTPLMQALLTAAQQRGIVLVFPAMDSTDKAALSAADISGFNDERIRAASQRYHADAVLAGAVAPAEGQFAARWQWLSPDKVEDWQTPAGDQSLVSVDGVQVAADRFAARYAVAPDSTDQDGVALQVDGIGDLDAYAKVLAYLGSLTPVRAVHVQRVAGGSVYYSLDIHGSLDNLESALVLGGLLSNTGTAAPAAASSDAQAAIPAPLHYSYKP
ncbi:MAG TPA: DUF2066 domain-containing protein [Gammaproteobacteria bacterium]|nr:DUF2066 domain-containing protein [Gammaproteobacteria bacterium]